MATKDNSPGLLSKVARFVRNPTTDWADLDNPVSAPDAGYSKQALKEMIERKRQNDFVRRREFDQLRKLRSRGPVAANPEQVERPSFFQTSTASNPDDRAMTLKKIDDIEAQMSKQWWKGRQGEAAAAPEGATPVAAAPVSDGATAASGADSVTTAVPPDQLGPAFAVTQTSELPHDTDPADHTDFAATMMSPAGAYGLPAAKPERDSGFPVSQNFADALGDGVTDPDLEEAAIRFANGDDAGAEAGLLEALKGDHIDQGSVHVWTATLFDFYRATGQQGRFDRAAMDFARRFGSVAPAWFSMPERLGSRPTSADEKTTPAALDGEPIWTSSPEFTLDALDGLNLAVANAPAPWYLDWSPLVSVHADAGEPLGQLLAYWAGAPLRLQFRGADSLERTLRFQTPSDDKRVGAAWWRLRMDALRIMGLQDEFELAALDYCVTFEVSPPAWVDARCEYIHEQPQTVADATDPGDLRPDAGMPEGGDDRAHAMTVLMGLDNTEGVPAAAVELSGDIMGDAAEALARLEGARRSGDRLVISCANLVRVDFSAAGSILNWVAQRQVEGYRVQFRDVHRLVAAFFHVIGIHEHARVVLRAN